MSSKIPTPRYSPRTNDTSLNSSIRGYGGHFNESQLSPSSISDPVKRYNSHISTEEEIRSSYLRQYQHFEQLQLIPMGEGGVRREGSFNSYIENSNPSEEVMEYDSITGEYERKTLSYVEIIHLDYQKRKSKVKNEFSHYDVKNQFKYHLDQFQQLISDDRKCTSSIVTSRDDNNMTTENCFSSIGYQGPTKESTQDTQINDISRVQTRGASHDIPGNIAQYQLIGQNWKITDKADISAHHIISRTEHIPKIKIKEGLNLQESMSNLNQYLSKNLTRRRKTISNVGINAPERQIVKNQNFRFPPIKSTKTYTSHEDQSKTYHPPKRLNQIKFKSNIGQTEDQLMLVTNNITVFLVDKIDCLQDMKKYSTQISIGNNYLSCFHQNIRSALDNQLLEKIQPYLRDFSRKNQEIQDFYERFTTQKKSAEEFPPVSKEEVLQVIRDFQSQDMSYRKFFDFVTFYFIPQITYRRQLLKDVLCLLNSQVQYIYCYGTDIQKIQTMASIEGEQLNQLFDIPFHTNVVWAGKREHIQKNISKFHSIYHDYLLSKEEQRARKRIQDNIESKFEFQKQPTQSPYYGSPKSATNNLIDRLHSIKNVTNQRNARKSTSPSVIYNIKEKLRKKQYQEESPQPNWPSQMPTTNRPTSNLILNRQSPEMTEIQEVSSGLNISAGGNQSNQNMKNKQPHLPTHRLSEMEIKFQNNTVSLVNLNQDVSSNIQPKRNGQNSSNQSILTHSGSISEGPQSNSNGICHTSPSYMIILGSGPSSPSGEGGNSEQNLQKQSSPRMSKKSEFQIDVERGLYLMENQISQYLKKFHELDQFLFLKYYTQFKACMMLNPKFEELTHIPSFMKIADDQKFKQIYLDILYQNSEALNKFSISECKRIFKAIGTQDIKEETENNYVQINLDQFILINLLFENKADDQKVAQFLINFFNHGNHYGTIPKKDVMDIMIKNIGVKNSSIHAPIIYAETLWKYFEQKLIATNDELSIQEFKGQTRQNNFVYRYAVGWILNGIQSDSNLNFEEIVNKI